MKQEVTRSRKGWALDNVTLHNEVLRSMAEEIKTSPSVCNRNRISGKVYMYNCVQKLTTFALFAK